MEPPPEPVPPAPDPATVVVDRVDPLRLDEDDEDDDREVESERVTYLLQGSLIATLRPFDAGAENFVTGVPSR